VQLFAGGVQTATAMDHRLDNVFLDHIAGDFKAFGDFSIG
jgi:hypothetical protein